MADPTRPENGSEKQAEESKDSGLERSFSAALRAAEGAADSAEAWDHLEELADKMQRPDEVALLYRQLLERQLPKEVFGKLAERAVQFHDEWFGDTPDNITGVLARIIELDPAADWAFERLTVMLTSAGKWDRLLAVYDRTLATTQSDDKRKRLLDDAAQVAKDFADDADRAADYMQQQLTLEPNNGQLVTSLERILERQQRFGDLIELWRSRIEQQSAEEARNTRVRMAVCWLDKMGQPQRAVEVLRELLSDSPGHAEACAQLERVMDMEQTDLDTRRATLSLLRKNYLVANRREDVVRVVQLALSFVEADEQSPLHREAATRLAILGRDLEALQHYRELLLRDPSDADARKQIRQLAKRSGRHDLHAQALVDAAEASEDASEQVAVLLEAASLRRTELADAEGAVELYRRVLASPEAQHTVALGAARHLAELLGDAKRDEERLAVLERLASLETSAPARRIVLGQAARLAEALSDVDRALSSWRPILSADPHDLEALAAVATLLEHAKRWPELVVALRKRAEAKMLPMQRRADLVRIAEVQTYELEQANDAIDTWLELRAEFGDGADTLAALDSLLAETSRWSELAELLSGAASRERGRAGELLARLGTIHLEQLEQKGEALQWFGRALGVNPENEKALAGLQALVTSPEQAKGAVQALIQAYRIGGHWQQILELLEARLQCARDGREQAELLREAAALYEEQASDAPRAFACLARALPIESANLVIEAELMRLAEQTGLYGETATALQAAANATSAPARAAQLHHAAGRLQELHIDDSIAALDAYKAAASCEADHYNALVAMTRCGGRASQWRDASEAAVRAVAARDHLQPELIATLETAAEETAQWPELAGALSSALADNPLRSELAQRLEMVVTRWFRDRCQDLDAAERAAARAVDHGPTNREAVATLAELQRRAPGAGLIATLLRLDSIEEHSLDPLLEAAKLALETEDDVVQTQAILEQLYRKAGGMWVRGEPALGSQTPSEIAQWGLDKLIAYHVFSGNAERAVHVLIDGARLPLDPDKAVNLRRRAGEMLAERGETGRAIDVYRGVLEARPRDMEALQRVAELCENEGRVSEALALRMRELALIKDPERRLQLRLDHSRLTGVLEAQGGRVASLKANLNDMAGHDESIEELCRVLEDRGRQEELAEVLGDQASKLELQEDKPRAAKLWAKVARVAEKPLNNVGLAIAAHSRVVELAPTNGSLDALARLHLERQEPAAAARWLERRLGTTASADRVAVLLKLSRAQIRAEQKDAAVSSLQTAFEEAPRNAEVRKLLLGLYRAAKVWEALADALTTAALAVSDEQTVLAYAREAAELYHGRLAKPEASVPVLRKAVELANEDRELRSLLAEGLRAAGELDAAKDLLLALVQDFGRRRSPERAGVHLQLALVAHAQGNIDEAIDQLETASAMDASNVTILKTLAERAQEGQQLDRAERAYRTLLITVRRESDAEKLPIGPTEVLVELSRIASERGQPDKASELVESAIESITQHDFEAERLQAKLSERGEHELLRRLLEARLTHVTAAHKRADIYSAQATVLEQLELPDDALSARCEAVQADPGSPLHHQAAWDSASAQGRLEQYVSVVEALLSDERADASAHVRCELQLRLGEVLEKEREDLERATDLYRQAEATGVRQVDVWRAQARVAGARGDADEQMRLLEQLASLGEDQAETRADALYRLAEVRLASPETLEEGMSSMAKALADDLRAERAGLILRRAADAHDDNATLLDLYEQVARKSEDRGLLLHYLQLRAKHPEATPEQAREAVDLAIELEELELAETLMLRAAEIGKSSLGVDGMQRVSWALLGLARRRLAAQDVAGAVKWLGEAAEVGDPTEVFALGREVAELAAAPDGDLTLAAKLYERLLERDPTVREAWGPLADIYARLGDVTRLERMVDETLDGLQEPAERNSLRISLAQALLTSQERAADAINVLQDVLVEDPEQQQAQLLLVNYFERSGQSEQLVELLRRQLAAAETREDPAAIKASALRLGQRLDASDPEDALVVLRRGLAQSPDDAELLGAVLERLDAEAEPREFAELSERLVRVEPEQSAGKRALQLFAMYQNLEDEQGALRVLQLGAERAPSNERIQELLQQHYREHGDFAGLVSSLLSAAERIEDEAERLPLWKEAAHVYSTQLDNPVAAAELLRQAARVRPQDVDLRIELANTLNLAGEHDAAVMSISDALEAAEQDASRLALLRCRADLQAQSGFGEAAIGDLELAFEIDPMSVAVELEEMLRQRHQEAAAANDTALQRTYTIRCIDVMLVQGKREPAADLLRDWTQRVDDDVEALRRLRDIDTADERWGDVAASCQRLVELETGSAQIDAALALSHAYHEMGQPELARAGLEHARQQQADSPLLRTELRKIYEQLGDQHSLAGLLLEDARAIDDKDEQLAQLIRAGQIFVELGDAVSAVPALREALALAPGDPGAIISLADAYIIAGWFDDASDLLDEAIAGGKGRRTPDLCLYYFRKAQVADALGDKNKQLELLQEAHLCSKKNGEVAAALADLAEEQQEWDLAAKTLRTITLIDSDCPISRAQAFYRQGRIAQQLGDEKSAKMWARRARREDPDSAEIESFLSDLGEKVSIPPNRR